MEMTHVAIDMLMHHPAESHQKEQDETSRFLKSWAWKREHRCLSVIHYTDKEHAYLRWSKELGGDAQSISMD